MTRTVPSGCIDAPSAYGAAAATARPWRVSPGHSAGSTRSCVGQSDAPVNLYLTAVRRWEALLILTPGNFAVASKTWVKFDPGFSISWVSVMGRSDRWGPTYMFICEEPGPWGAA